LGGENQTVRGEEGVRIGKMNRAAFDQILALPASERVELAQRIWESVIDQPENLPLTAAQKNELERRWTAFEQNPEEGEPWDEVRKSLLGE
jgi:putative addiction module component (TIGR02574 family)